MDEILKFVFCMIIFLIATKVGGGKPYFHPFYYFPSSLHKSYTIFYHILVTTFYDIFSLQNIMNVKLMLIVQNIRPYFLLWSVSITYVDAWKLLSN